MVFMVFNIFRVFIIIIFQVFIMVFIIFQVFIIFYFIYFMVFIIFQSICERESKKVMTTFSSSLERDYPGISKVNPSHLFLSTYNAF